MEGIVKLLLWVLIIVIIIGGLAAWLGPRVFNTGVTPSARYQYLDEFFKDPASHADWMIQPGERCGDAPFQMPTQGYIGFLWDDSFRPGHRHQGIDIFSGTEPGETPVYAASDGYLTRLADWKSSVILRLPEDPLQPGRQIWAYYTHMADPQGNSFIAEDFPPGTKEVFVKAGTLLGQQGNFSGTPGNPTGVHLHISVVLDDGKGQFLNELEINNTLDPSPYLGLPLNAHTNEDTIPLCTSEITGGQQ